MWSSMETESSSGNEVSPEMIVAGTLATVGMREGTVAARLGSEEVEGRWRWVLVIGTKRVAGEEGCDWKWWSCGLGPCWVSSEWKNTAGKCRRRSPELLIVYRGR
ncbi:hypothetical protein L2E82_40436 [Cichorium intybus]|uniref:Uncharacterized protein n=1 Tax=Cichorium intybus TaxID=13427 RepID=A0ACB9AKA7_CICIN|nr:hypothetical protein L2E82_40436 [Cichorium intybus]